MERLPTDDVLAECDQLLLSCGYSSYSSAVATPASVTSYSLAVATPISVTHFSSAMATPANVARYSSAMATLQLWLLPNCGYSHQCDLLLLSCSYSCQSQASAQTAVILLGHSISYFCNSLASPLGSSRSIIV